jgi:hypothetical protein
MPGPYPIGGWNKVRSGEAGESLRTWLRGRPEGCRVSPSLKRAALDLTQQAVNKALPRSRGARSFASSAGVSEGLGPSLCAIESSGRGIGP